MTEGNPSRQLAEMRNVAFELGMVFGEEAKRTQDIDRKLGLFDAFHKAFASVRLAIALDLRLRKPVAQAQERETERGDERAEAPDWTERADALRYAERDRDRETERATLPGLLRTLGGVLTAAEELVPDAPEVPQLRAILAKAKPEPAPSRPAPSRDLRSRLAGSTTTQVLLRPGLRPPPSRRSTGPP